MNYRRLGRSGVKVSEVALGSWLTFGHAVDQATTNRCVAKALDCGINFIDTADVYALGKCETALGKALAEVSRKDYVLATKVFFPTGPGVNDRGLSRKHMRESLDASLLRLRTDYIDLYQCHRHDPETPMEEIVQTMDGFIRQGKINYWGVSMWPADEIERVGRVADEQGAVRPVSNQPPYNLLERDIENGVIATSASNGLSQVVYSPLAQGLLTGKYAGGIVPPDSRAADSSSNQFIKARMTEANLSKVEKLTALAKEVGRPLYRLALAWCLRDPNVASVIIGATKVEQIEANAKASGEKIEPELLARIDAIIGRA